MSFYIGKIKIPVYEAGLKVSRNREYTNVPILNGDTVTVMGRKGLLQVSYSSFFPHDYGTYCDVGSSELKPPKKYKELLEDIRDDENYVLVRITELGINTYCKIISLDFEPENGVGDIAYTIKLEEYNQVENANVVYVAPVADTPVVGQTETAATTATTTIATTLPASVRLTGTPRASKTVQPQYYTLNKNDTVWTVAAKFNMSPQQLMNDNPVLKTMFLASTQFKQQTGQLQVKVKGQTDSAGNRILKLSSGRTVNLGK